jgi:hypothetical protein
LLKKLSVRRENREQGTGNREQGTGNREQGTGNREQGTGNSFNYLNILNFSLTGDKEKCNCFETPFAKTLHLLVLKIRETPINKRL